MCDYSIQRHGNVKCTIQRAPCMRVISVYFRLNLCKLYDGPIRLLADHDFTVRCIHEAVGWYLDMGIWGQSVN